MEDRKIRQQGNNNFTEISDDRVLKSPNPHGVGFLELPYDQQAEQWNKYYAGTSYATACVTDDKKLSTPYIEGSHPNDEQRLAICESMLAKGFIMVDCRDKRNFIVDQEGKVFPVDFGQIYTKENRFYKMHLAVVQREMDTIKHRAQKSQPKNIFQDVDVYIDALESYKVDLTQNSKQALVLEKVQQIDLFIADTKERIRRYNAGEKNAFDDYVDANKQSLQMLAQNRMSRPILYSMLLSLLVIPMIFGVIQLAMTKGNTYLFFTAVKESEKRALNVQNKVLEIKDNDASKNVLKR